MTRIVVAATFACLAAALAIAAVLLSWLAPSTRASAICPALDDLSEALNLDSVGDQAVVRSRAATLADLLADHQLGASGPRAAGSQAAEHDQIAEQITALLADPGASVAQLVAALEPVSEECETPLTMG